MEEDPLPLALPQAQPSPATRQPSPALRSGDAKRGRRAKEVKEEQRAQPCAAPSVGSGGVEAAGLVSWLG
jgi:hypothetical protein